MKRIFGFILALFTAVSLFGCMDKKHSSEESTNETTAVTKETSAETNGETTSNDGTESGTTVKYPLAGSDDENSYIDFVFENGEVKDIVFNLYTDSGEYKEAYKYRVNGDVAVIARSGGVDAGIMIVGENILKSETGEPKKINSVYTCISFFDYEYEGRYYHIDSLNSGSIQLVCGQDDAYFHAMKSKVMNFMLSFEDSYYGKTDFSKQKVDVIYSNIGGETEVMKENVSELPIIPWTNVAEMGYDGWEK